jgi:hypothetical protein
MIVGLPWAGPLGVEKYNDLRAKCTGAIYSGSALNTKRGAPVVPKPKEYRMKYRRVDIKKHGQRDSLKEIGSIAGCLCSTGAALTASHV